jgi:hypothetical protein
MGLCTFIFLVFFLTYISCGMFTYYLDWGRTPTRLFHLMRQSNGTVHYYMLEPFLRTITMWPFYLKSTWRSRWASLLWRVKIIIFVSLTLFVTLSVLNIYFYFDDLDLHRTIILAWVLWISSGIFMYIACCIYTNNKNEALSGFGLTKSLFLFMVPGPLSFRKIYEELEAIIHSTNAPNNRSVFLL